MRLEKEQADHKAHLAKKEAEAAKARAEKEKAEQAAADEAEREASSWPSRSAASGWWKWGARGIYAVGLIIAAPVQFIHFWDPKRPFLVAAPASSKARPGPRVRRRVGRRPPPGRRPLPGRHHARRAIAAAINMYGGPTRGSASTPA
jgi:hypothetical protein